MNRYTGLSLSDIDHVRQSITDILTTPIGSRVIRRDYGSRLYQLVDAPINQALFVEIYSAVADALRRWEPRITLTRVHIDTITVGTITLRLEGLYVPLNEPVLLEGLVV